VASPVAKTGDKAKVSAWSRELVLPNAETWFKKVFGDELGKKVAAEYRHEQQGLRGAGWLARRRQQARATEVRSGARRGRELIGGDRAAEVRARGD
jgi:hypothetical protein